MNPCNSYMDKYHVDSLHMFVFLFFFFNTYFQKTYNQHIAYIDVPVLNNTESLVAFTLCCV